MPFVYLNKIRQAYSSAGSGHPLLLIPGVGYSSWFWERIAPGLLARYHLVSPDPRGTGESSTTVEPLTLEMLASDLATLLDRLHIRGAFLAGHGMGGYLALLIALERPELVSKLVLMACRYGGPTGVPMTQHAHDVLTDREGEPIDILRRNIELATTPDFGASNPDVIEALVQYRLSGAVGPAIYQAQVKAAAIMASADASLEERLAGIPVPTLLLYGAEDQMVPPANAELYAAHLPAATTVILPDAGHLFPVEIPEATVDALAGFLGGTHYVPPA